MKLRSLLIAALLGVFATFSVAEAAPLPAALAAQVQAAVCDSAALQALVNANPAFSAEIAQAAADQALKVTTTNPTCAANAALFANLIAEQISEANPAAANRIASTTADVSRALNKSQPAAAAAIIAGSAALMKKPAVAAANPSAASSVISIFNVDYVPPSALTESNSPITPIDPSVVSPSS